MQKPLFHLGSLHINTLRRVILCCLLLSVTFSSFSQDKTSISYKVKGYHENGIYGPRDSKVAYILKLKNNINDNQKGNIYVNINNDLSQSVYNENISIFIKPGSVYDKDVEIDVAKLPTGFYTISFNITTNHYSQYLYYVFAVEPEKIKPTGIRPSDFSPFWDNARNELTNINPSYKITRRGDLSTVSNDIYLIEFQSIGNVTIRGWLSIPKRRKSNPVMYRLPDYATIAAPESRNDMAVFCLDARGFGNSSDMGGLDYNTYLIKGLYNKENYIYRAQYMDCLRGLDFLVKNSTDLKLDPNKIITVGIGQGATMAAVVAAFDNRIKGVILDRPTLMDMRTMFAIGEIKGQVPWPIPSFKSYCGTNRMKLDNFFKIWDYFDPLSFAPMIKSPILVGTSLKNAVSPPQCAYNFYNQVLSSTREIYSCPDNENGIDDSFYIFENNWIKETLRL